MTIECVKIGNATLYCGDNRDVLPSLERPAAVITDPPYGISLNTAIMPRGRSKSGRRGERPDGSRYGQVYNPIHGDDAPFDPGFIFSVSDIVLLWGVQHFAAALPDGGRFGQWLLWDKRVGVIPPNDQGDGETAWLNRRGPLRIYRQMWSGMVREGDYFRSGQASSGRAHPTEKPVGLMRWCIEQARVLAGGVILDPFMGAGSTGVAAMIMGHPFIGIEIERRYFDTACGRIEQAQRQADMFVAPPPAPQPTQEAML